MHSFSKRPVAIVLFVFSLFGGFGVALAQKAGDNKPQQETEFDHADGRGAWFTHLITGSDTGDVSTVLIHDAEVFKSLDNSAAFKGADGIASAQPTWEQVGTSQDSRVSGRATGIAFDPTNSKIIYLAEPQAGLWKTTDHGVSWTYLSQSWVTNAMGAVAVDPNNPQVIYAATGDIDPQNGDALAGVGMYKSVDGGLNWTLTATTTDIGNRSYEVIVDPSNSNVIYHAGSNGVTKSTDAGSTWTNVLRQAGITSIVLDDSNTQNIVSCWNGGQMMKSVNGGATWIQVGTNLQRFYRGTLANAASLPTTIYASLNVSSSSGCVLAVSTDGGSTWRVANTSVDWLGQQGWYANSIAVSNTNPNQVLVGGLDIFSSSNGGASLRKITDWTASSTAQNFTHADIHKIVYGNDGVYTLTDGGVYYSNSNGQSWQQYMNKGLTTLQFVGVDATNDCSIVFGGAQDNGVNRVDVSSLASTPFASIQGGDGGNTYVSQEDNGQTLYSTHYSSPGDASLLKSIDGGNSFLNGGYNIISDAGLNNDGLPFYMNYAVCESDANTICVAGSSGAWYSNDGGNTFTIISSPVTVNCANEAVHISAYDPTTVYAGAANGKIYCSYQGGAFYASAKTVGSVTCIQSDPNDATRAFAVSNGNTTHFWITTNAGVSWSKPATNFPNISTLSVAYDPKTGNLFAGTTAGVLASGDTGKTWQPLSTGLPILEMKTLHVRGHYLLAGTYGRGAFRLDLTNLQLGITNRAVNGQPVGTNGLTLSNIYPNPVQANVATRVSFALPKSASARLSLFDALGREVRVVENANLAAGSYERTLDVTGLSAGKYYYALTALGSTISHSLVIVH